MYVQPRNTRNQFAIYKLSSGDKLLYIGVCRYSELMQFPDANKNTEFCRIVKHTEWLECETIQFNNNLETATNIQQQLIKEWQPYCNVYGSQFNHSSPVRCITTGQVYENAATAAIECGISRQSMSNHLNGREGYASVKKLQFERI